MTLTYQSEIICIKGHIKNNLLQIDFNLEIQFFLLHSIVMSNYDNR